MQEGAGSGSAMSDEQFAAQGAADRRRTREAVFARAELVLKVKEPQPVEVGCCARGRRCSPTCTSPPSPSSRADCGVGRDVHRL